MTLNHNKAGKISILLEFGIFGIDWKDRCYIGALDPGSISNRL